MSRDFFCLTAAMSCDFLCVAAAITGPGGPRQLLVSLVALVDQGWCWPWWIQGGSVVFVYEEIYAVFCDADRQICQKSHSTKT